MLVDLDTFLVALYTLVDELYQAEIAPHKPVRRGHRPELSDSEVLTLLLCAQWLGNSERAMGRYATTYWRSYFPRLLSQSDFNRRARDLGGVCAHLITVVARELGVEQTPYQVVDTCSPMRRASGAAAAIGTSTMAARRWSLAPRPGRSPECCSVPPAPRVAGYWMPSCAGALSQPVSPGPSPKSQRPASAAAATSARPVPAGGQAVSG